MAHIEGTAGNSVHRLEGRDDLAATEDLDLQGATGRRGDELGKLVGSRAEAGEVLRPSRLHAQALGALRQGRFGERGGGGHRRDATDCRT